MLAFEDNCFCFEVTAFFFTKRVSFYSNVYKEHPLFDKKTYNWKTKVVIFKSKRNFLDIIKLMLLAKFEFDRWFHFFQKQGIIKK